MTPIADIQLNEPVTQSPKTDPQAGTKAEFGRLIHAAIINTRFRQLLITNPVNTIEKGYLGESFYFPNDVKNQIQNIHAGNLEEFSSQVVQIIETTSVPEIAVLHYR